MLRKKFVPINDVFDRLYQNRLNTWFDKLTFPHILLVWISIIVIFGLTYFYAASDTSYLFYNIQQKQVTELIDSIYFSFITATSTGFGDIVPTGAFKLIAIVEVISGLLLLAFVTSKLVSIKQDIILTEIYEISYTERVNRLRSSLLLFRQHITSIISKIEHNTVSKREVSDVYITISSFEDSLQEIFGMMGKSTKTQFTRVMAPLETELIFNSIIHSFDKLRELLALMNHHNLEWKREVTIHAIAKCLEVNKYLFEKLNTVKNLSEKAAHDLTSRNNVVVEEIKKELRRENKVSV